MISEMSLETVEREARATLLYLSETRQKLAAPGRR